MHEEVEMINGIGSTGSGHVAHPRSETKATEQAAAPTATTTSTRTSDVSASPAAAMASQGAPIDMDKINAIKQAISEGRYPVNAKAIAEKMLSLDLPSNG